MLQFQEFRILVFQDFRNFRSSGFKELQDFRTCLLRFQVRGYTVYHYPFVYWIHPELLFFEGWANISEHVQLLVFGPSKRVHMYLHAQASYTNMYAQVSYIYTHMLHAYVHTHSYAKSCQAFTDCRPLQSHIYALGCRPRPLD